MNRRIRRRHTPTETPAGADLHPVLGKVFASRGIAIDDDLSLGLGQLLPPDDFAGVGAAAALLADAIAHNERILLVGDFDADGATSIAVATTMLTRMGAGAVDYLVPNRFEYGYGLTPEIVELARQREPAVIVTVDNGISSLEGVARAGELGIRTLVTDHHLPGAQLPAADVIVNPSQPGCGFPSKALAGVGVIFYVLSVLRRHLQAQGWFAGRDVPSMAEVLDLVALGTVADVVPLDRNNRILVQQGLLRIRAGETRPGIRALLDVAGRALHRVVASDLSFAVAPRLNAAGRLDDMSIGIECLLAASDDTARSIAAQLDDLNRDRQHIERGMQQEAAASLEALDIDAGGALPNSLCLYRPGWHQGVVGILASRIKDRLHRPVIAFADSEDGSLKGSARSIPGLHIRDALDRVAATHPGLVTKFGGHAMAAGLSLPRENLDAFGSALETVVGEWLDNVELEAVVESDGELPADALELELARLLRYAAPWGQHFPEPVFDGLFEVLGQRIVGDRHLKLVLVHPEQPGRPLDAIAFNVDTGLWPDESVRRLLIAYRLDCNYFRGEERLQLMVEHLEPA